MKQYNQIKAKHPDALLLFRVGDFYETFGSDAIKAAGILGITLTKRKNGAAAYVELAGFPHHAMDTYLPKLVRAGERVAICDQLEDPKQTKTIVKRGVTELVTPGVAFNQSVLENKTNNFLAAVYFSGNAVGVAFADVSTGEFAAAQGSADYAQKLLHGFDPKEILYERNKQVEIETVASASHYCYALDDWMFNESSSTEALLNHFKTKSIKGYGLQQMPLAVTAAGAIIQYLKQTRHDKLEHLRELSRIDENEFVWLDSFTLRNLEIFQSNSAQGPSLLKTIDRTISPMGSRLLKRWLSLPLKQKDAIESRLKLTDALVKATDQRNNIREGLEAMGDLERLVSRVAIMKVAPRELLQLRRSLELLPLIAKELQASKQGELKTFGNQLKSGEECAAFIANSITEEAPVALHKGDVIRSGYSGELDELRDVRKNARGYIASLQQGEIERTGITSLKVGFNNVFGYYLEVTNAHKAKVPEEWTRKQTLVNAERYVTPELKAYEEKIVDAESRIASVEANLYTDVVMKVNEYLEMIQHNAKLVARLDCLAGFAELAVTNNYCIPAINEGRTIQITEGRHPVIEKQLPIGETYIPNDVFLDTETQQIIMLTGPNMSGKSAVLRQTALIVLLAQIGSFVPAKAAEIGWVDKIFTRVGASDNLSEGESTFMVEMTETASILNNLSDRSLILLDEIGRGTSTYDGISIAWAIADYLHHHPSRPKVLFATHYHELNDMSDRMERIKNFSIAIKESGKDILFLRKLVPQGSEHSFGIHVARLAGMPQSVVANARKLLRKLEANRSNEKPTAVPKDDFQLSFFQLDDPLLEEIKQDLMVLDIDTLAPVEALMLVNDIKKRLSRKEE